MRESLKEGQFKQTALFLGQSIDQLARLAGKYRKLGLVAEIVAGGKYHVFNVSFRTAMPQVIDIARRRTTRCTRMSDPYSGLLCVLVPRRPTDSKMNEAKERFAPDKIVKMGSLHPPPRGWRQQLKRHSGARPTGRGKRRPLTGSDANP